MLDLKEVKKKLEEERKVILERIMKLTRDKLRKDGPLEADFAEQAVSLENSEVVDALDETSRQELEQIDNALKRIESKTYGVCLDCGEKIGEKRLLALPYAQFCVNCSDK